MSSMAAAHFRVAGRAAAAAPTTFVSGDLYLQK